MSAATHPLHGVAVRLCGAIASTITVSVAVGVTAPHWPSRWLDRDRGPLRLTRYETRERYERAGIRFWKQHFPEGGAWAGGESKSSLPDLGEPRAVIGYIRETRRAELVHWTSNLAWLPALAFAEPWIVAPVAVITIAINSIAIAIVRYNRLRLVETLDLRSGS